MHSHEPTEISLKFGLDKPHGRKLEFFFWQDVHGIGPERAYEYCWDRFPDRDVVILHSDMAPMPDDLSNHWYDALIDYRNTIPNAGMIACNLFYPRPGLDEPWRVQCAGGTFREGQIGHMHGPVQKDRNPPGEGVAETALRSVRAVDWVTFGGVLIRREVIRACGPFDRRYKWAYVMDVDYCFEARLRGFRLLQVPISLQHEAQRTTRAAREKNPQLYEHLLRNFDLFYDKWRPFGTVLARSTN
jgi:GT2 family glycosyltransferase